MRTAHVKIHHVKGTLIPADAILHGVSVRTRKSNDIWLNEPSHLLLKEPPIANALQLLVLEMPEQTVESSNVVSKENLLDITRYSTLSKLENVVARVLMYCNVLRYKIGRATKLTWLQCVQRARKLLLRAEQETHYRDIFSYWASRDASAAPSLITQFGLYLDESNLIRCRGRMENSSDSTKACPL